MFRESFSKLDRLQHSRLFKVIATVVIVLAALAAGATYAIRASKVKFADSSAGKLQINEDAVKAAKLSDEERKQAESYAETYNRYIDRMRAGEADPSAVAVGLASGAALCIAAVWLGMGLTVVGLLVVSAVVVGPLAAFEATRDWSRLLAGVTVLALAFVTSIRLFGALFSLPGVTFAVARNTLSEAVRLKLSLVFIVLLLFMLASIPGLLSPDSPLRYRVQSFLSWGTGGAFWIIAVLVLLFAVSTVATEQRDKIIWQTMTKPVAPWQYVLGKWLGVTALAAALLAVTGVGVFLFSQYLRNLPAKDEDRPFVTREGPGLTPDRAILETQVLASRVIINSDPPAFDDKLLNDAVDQQVKSMSESSSGFVDSPDQRLRVRDSLKKSFENAFRSLTPGDRRMYRFSGLARARELGSPVTLRWRVDSGANRPDQLYKITMGVPNYGQFVRETPLGQYLTESFPPTAIHVDGNLYVEFLNGDVTTGARNPMAINFPKDGLSVSYSEGGFGANFTRVFFVLWLKLAFLAMIAVWSATFLSFSVASIVSFGVFFCAESASFLAKALEVYDEFGTTQATMNDVVWYKFILVKIAKGVSWSFSVYGDLRPADRLVEGELLGWADVSLGVVVLSAVTAGMFAMAWYIFSKRELAIYSGQ